MYLYSVYVAGGTQATESPPAARATKSQVRPTPAPNLRGRGYRGCGGGRERGLVPPGSVHRTPARGVRPVVSGSFRRTAMWSVFHNLPERPASVTGSIQLACGPRRWHAALQTGGGGGGTRLPSIFFVETTRGVEAHTIHGRRVSLSQRETFPGRACYPPALPRPTPSSAR